MDVKQRVIFRKVPFRYIHIHYWKQDVFNIRIEMLIYCAPDPDSRLEKSLLDPGIMSLSYESRTQIILFRVGRDSQDDE